MRVSLHHRVVGPSDGPPVVLSNALGTTSAMWAAQVAALAPQFRVVTFDIRGHGGSAAPPPPPWTIDDLGRDVVRLLDDLRLDNVAFAGVSLGGMLGMWLAANAPRRIDRLVLICTSAHLGAAGYWRERAATVRADGMTAIVDPVVDRWFTPRFGRQHPDVVREYKEAFVKLRSDGYAACCEAIGAMDLTADLARVTAPTLVLAGADDLAIPPEHGAAIAAGIPDASFVTVAAAAHLAGVEQPDVITRHLYDHLLAKE